MPTTNSWLQAYIGSDNFVKLKKKIDKEMRPAGRSGEGYNLRKNLVKYYFTEYFN